MRKSREVEMRGTSVSWLRWSATDSWQNQLRSGAMTGEFQFRPPGRERSRRRGSGLRSSSPQHFSRSQRLTRWKSVGILCSAGMLRQAQGRLCRPAPGRLALDAACKIAAGTVASLSGYPNLVSPAGPGLFAFRVGPRRWREGIIGVPQ